MRQFKHLLGIYRIGEINELKEHAWLQLSKLPAQLQTDNTRKVKEAEFKKITPRIEIHLFLVDNEKE